MMQKVFSLLIFGAVVVCSGTAAAQEKPIASFSGELTAGQAYSQEIPPRLLFSLIPVVGGWSATVTGIGSCGNAVSITVPASSLQAVLPTPAAPNAQPSLQLPPPNKMIYALSCNDHELFIKGNECRADGNRRCTDMGAVAAGQIILTVTSFVPQRRSYNAPAAYLQIKFNVDVYAPSPSGAN